MLSSAIVFSRETMAAKAVGAEPRNISTEAAEQAYTEIDAAIKKMAEDAVKRQSEYTAQLDDVTGRIETLVKAYDELEISDTAAADAEVTDARQAMEKAIADLQKKEITPDNIADVETAVAAADVGVIVDNISTVKAISDAIQTGMPLIERVATVTGEKIKNPGNYIIKIGTSVKELIDYCGGTTDDDVLIKMGGPMMGFALSDLNVPMMKGSNGIIAIEG